MPCVSPPRIDLPHTGLYNMLIENNYEKKIYQNLSELIYTPVKQEFLKGLLDNYVFLAFKKCSVQNPLKGFYRII